MPVNENDYAQRMEGVNIAFSQLTPIIKEQDETIKKLQTEIGEVEVKEVEPTVTTYRMEEFPSVFYKFPQVISEANITPQVEEFSFSNVFANFDEQIRKAEKPYMDIKDKSELTSKYKLDLRANCIANCASIKGDFLRKAEAEIKRLKSVSVQLPYMTDSEKLHNEMTKVSNMLMLQAILDSATSNVEMIEELYVQNQNNAEIRKVLMLHAHKIFRTEKETRVRDKALKLYGVIRQKDEEFYKRDEMIMLDKILFNIRFIFNTRSNGYPTNIAQLNSDFKMADGTGVRWRDFFAE